MAPAGPIWSVPAVTVMLPSHELVAPLRGDAWLRTSVPAPSLVSVMLAAEAIAPVKVLVMPVALSTDPPPLLSVIGGLGGKDISEGELDAVLRDLERAAAGERVVSPRLLYTKPDQERTRTLLKIAGKEVAA